MMQLKASSKQGRKGKQSQKSKKIQTQARKSNQTQKNIFFTPHPRQDEFIAQALSGKYFHLTYGGGKGGGKSFVCIAIALIMCRAFPGSRWAIIRKDDTNLRLNTIPTFWKVCPNSFVDRVSGNVVHFTNGSEIIFMSEGYQYDKQLSRFDGLELNGVIIDQIEETQEKLLDIVSTAPGRNRIDPMPPSMILSTINPTQNWSRTRIYDRWKTGTLPSDWFYLPALVKDNPDLYNDKKYMSQFDTMNPVLRARLLDGDWDAFETDNQFIYTFDYEVNTTDNLKFNFNKPVYLSFDFNVNPMTCKARQGDHAYIHNIKEFRKENSDLLNFLSDINAYFPPKRIFFVTGDPSGRNRNVASRGLMNNFKIIENYLKKHGHHVIIKKLKSDPGHEKLRDIGNLMMAHFPELLYDRKGCAELIRDIQFVAANDQGKRDKAAEAKEGKGHLLDCDLYDYATFYRDWIKRLSSK